MMRCSRGVGSSATLPYWVSRPWCPKARVGQEVQHGD